MLGGVYPSTGGPSRIIKIRFEVICKHRPVRVKLWNLDSLIMFTVFEACYLEAGAQFSFHQKGLKRRGNIEGERCRFSDERYFMGRGKHSSHMSLHWDL